MQYLPYDSFIDLYRIATNRTTEGYPNIITVSPSNSLMVALIPPDSTYTIVGSYYKDHTTLTLDADTPEMPSRFHMAIVYLAMQYYAMWESAPEVLARGKSQYSKMIVRLENDQLQPITIVR
jgi:hypothetical protein